MTDPSDDELLAQYAGTKSEPAFAALVERHVNLVYSAARRFTGDAQHAQDITQAVFVLLARKAAGLRRGTVLSGWLYHTARLTAANFVRGEIRRQLREQEAYMESTLAKSDPPAWEQIAPFLDEAMGRLGAIDRNAIVLRFFENRSTPEVAAALRLNEAAARKRVSRALEKLRGLLTRRGVTLTTGAIVAEVSAHAVEAAPSGLAVVVTTTAAKGAMVTAGAGLGSAVLSALGKSALLAWLVPFFTVVATLPGLAAVSSIHRMENKNFLDPKGFRSQAHRRFFGTFLWGFPLLAGAGAAFNWASRIWGIHGQMLFLAGLMLVMTAIAARSLVIARNRYQLAMFFYMVILTVGIAAMALRWIPPSLSSLPMLVATIWLLLVFSQRPAPRMDYSLFRRAACGQLRTEETAGALAFVRPALDRKSLLEFARFLGSRYLVMNFRWEAQGLALRLQPVQSRFLSQFLAVIQSPVSSRCSYLLLGWNGLVRARCGQGDALDLAASNFFPTVGVPEMEQLVGLGVELAWKRYREGKVVAAERALGQIPEAEIFLVPIARAKASQWWRRYLGICLLLMAAGTAIQLWMAAGHGPPVWMAGLKSVHLTDAQVRAFLDSPVPAQAEPDDPGYLAGAARLAPNSPKIALQQCLVLPPKSMFSPGGWQRMHEEVAREPPGWVSKNPTEQAQWVLNNPSGRRAVEGGWISWADLQIRPSDVAIWVRGDRVTWFVKRREGIYKFVWANYGGADNLTQLRLLRSVGGLAIVDRRDLIQQIAATQVLTGMPAGQPPIRNWPDVRGLLVLHGRPALEATYWSLASLEILGGLNQIDREACILGILRRHRGQGYFTSPDSGGVHEVFIDGSAHDTIAAFESLRILGALDRVRDLDRWQFRVKSGQSSSPAADGSRALTWDEVEAWVCQQRLKQILSLKKNDPQEPFGSLCQAGAI